MSDDTINAEAFHNFSFGIFAVFCSLVSDVSIKLGEHLQSVENSAVWTENEEKHKQAVKGVRRATLFSLSICLILVIASAIGIGIPSKNLDERMVFILEGLSLIFAAVVLGALSVHVATWTGVYYKIWPHQQQAAASMKQLQFDVRWSFYRIFTKYFFFLLPFYQGVRPWTIPISILAGIALGLVTDFGVFVFRRKPKKTRKIASAAVTFIFVCSSSVLMAIGVWYIVLVWEKVENPKKDLWTTVVFFLCLGVEGAYHLGRGCMSRKLYAREESAKSGVISSTSSNADPMSPNRPRMALSLIAKNMEREFEHRSKNVDETHESNHNNDSALIDETVAQLQSDAPSSQELDKSNEKSVQIDEEATEIKVQDEDREVVKNPDEDDNVVEPTYRQMLCVWKCCGCVRGDERTPSEKAYSFINWTIWVVLVCFSLFLVVTNVGSTAQQDNARAKLPYVDSVLYETINEGPVCAFDNRGPDSNITTFDDKEAAHVANFSIVHCGACGACSTWHNLWVNYNTRDYLAKKSAKCAKKVLLHGSSAVLECLKQPPIEFQGECAVCWTEDILCTKKFCAFIYLQSVMINTVSNFQVDAETITSAACEEAHCEAGNPGDFVYCSGATRRRMNVTSTIGRPGTQRCGIVDVDWAEVFANYTGDA